MNILPCPPGTIADVKLVQTEPIADARGSFTELYRHSQLREAGISFDVVQQNRSLSLRAGTVRGLHFQIPPHAQAKLVRVASGAAFDVAVDLRQESATYGQWVATRLEGGGPQIFIPRGFAHGFCTLQPDTIVEYLVDAEYAPEHDRGIAWDDPDVAVRWPEVPNGYILSDRDRRLPALRALGPVFTADDDGGSGR
ncbi:MAG: dTDP-4-dehydrorhamnose 3,5-epimerase [Alphaproteobacteria bacterium]|nr:dTDP-4-dehydrorhamnose 3,5-epimerase [Alphaproteobacteria bacterium]